MYIVTRFRHQIGGSVQLNFRFITPGGDLNAVSYPIALVDVGDEEALDVAVDDIDGFLAEAKVLYGLS